MCNPLGPDGEICQEPNPSSTPRRPDCCPWTHTTSSFGGSTSADSSLVPWKLTSPHRHLFSTQEPSHF